MALSLQEPTAHPMWWPERQSSVPSLPFSCRELLRCEAALARLYCRMALLNIFAPKLPHLFTRLFHIPAIRDITLEHLQLLSNQLLAPPLPGKPWLCCCHCRHQTQDGIALRVTSALSRRCAWCPHSPYEASHHSTFRLNIDKQHEKIANLLNIH